MTTPPEPPRQRPWLTLSATMAVQLLASLCLSAAAVLAPAVAPTLGIAPEAVGVFVGCAYLFAMVVGLGSGGWVPRWGGTRVSMAALGVIAAGMAVSTQGLSWALLAAAALVVVGAGYGCTNPAAAALLAFHAPKSAPGLFFSLKQAAVPIGVTLAGLLLPLGLATIGWRATLWIGAACCVLLALLFVPLTRRLEPGRTASASAAGPGWLASLLHALRVPVLRRLSLMSLAYAMTQQGFLAFIVSLLHLELGLPLALAAGLLATSQVGSTLMRIALGHVADRWVQPRLLLIVVVVVACGTTAAGWNGVFFAELVRNVPRREEMAAAAGGTQFFTFAGGMLGPFLFAQVVHLTGSYSMGYLGLAVAALAAGVTMLRRPAAAPNAARATERSA